MRNNRAAVGLAVLFFLSCHPVAIASREPPVTGVAGVLSSRLENLDSDLAKLYAGRDYAPLWTSPGHFAGGSRALLSVLRGAATHGLDSRYYHAERIQRVAALPLDQYSTEQKADIELLYSGALLGYVEDLLFGRARRVELADSSFNVDETMEPVTAVATAVENGTLTDLVKRAAPATRPYAALREALSRLRSIASDERFFDLPDVTLHPGDEGGEIAALRRRLVLLGDLPEVHDDNRGVFDAPLVDAVKRFQSRHGLDVDGVVGRETRAALEVPLSSRIQQVVLSLERWRWLPRDPGYRYLVVNIGAQELEVVENGWTTLHMRVIVGLPFKRTPSFASEVRTVVLNPYWEVPYSIAVKEILPKLRKDPQYLGREHMQVLKRGTNELVNPIPIDWKQVSGKNFPYRFRQKPGPDNALGKVKFLMPNKYNVYLHDTPAKTLFSKSRRCFSHGCVRLEKPLELADLLLHDEPGWSFERVEKTLETEKNYRIKLTKPMPVYLVYWTAWVDNKGIVNFRNDVYGRDERLKSALETLKSKNTG